MNYNTSIFIFIVKHKNNSQCIMHNAQLLYNCYTTIALIKNYFLTFSKVNINTIVINELTNVFNKTIPKYLNEKASKENNVKW